MKVGNDVIGIMQVQIAIVETERQASEAADAKHGQKGHHEKHRSIEAN